MDHQNNNGGGGNGMGGDSSWSIPKKSTDNHSNLNNDNQRQAPSMSSMSMAIPRKSSSSNTHNTPSSNTVNSTEFSIPRKRPSQQQQQRSSASPSRTVERSKSLSSDSSSSKKKSKRRSLPTATSSTSSSSPASGDGVPPNVVSTSPFVIRISLRGVPWRGSDGITTLSTSTRTSKRERPTYQELEDTDDDLDLFDSDDDDDDEEEDIVRRTSTKIIKKKGKTSKNGGRSSSSRSGGSGAAVARSALPPDTLKQSVLSAFASGPSVSNMNTVTAKDFLLLENTNVESPPQGALNTLWYSREVFVNTFVLEKVLGWKTRPVTRLEWDPTKNPQTPSTPPTLDLDEAIKLSNKALTSSLVWEDPNKRTEVSRLNHVECPIVSTLACEAQNNVQGLVVAPQGTTRTSIVDYPVDGVRYSSTASATEQSDQSKGESAEQPTPPDQSSTDVNGPSQSATQSTNDKDSVSESIHKTNGTVSSTPTIRTRHADGEREEVYLVKWRGKSHRHVSWERESDLIRFDQTANTARHKIRRFVQSQELSYGLNWKQVLEAERNTSANIHAHGGQPHEEDLSEGMDEEYYPPASTEIERILACDESEMSVDLFAKQRALNILAEQDRVEMKENGNVVKWNSKEGLKEILADKPWDPEDNVRYVVKWKDVPFAEMTWEYWRDIKTDAVDQAEDFWFRQTPFDDTARDALPHPNIRDFKKIQESPVYGISSRERPVAETVDGRAVPKNEEEEVDADDNQGLRLRGYQLEGVNWLLFNWWNKRSCILADEMGLGKTIQSVGFLKLLQDLPDTGVRGPFLIVAPLSLVGQWQSEIATWAPDLNVLLYHGSADARSFLVKQEFFLTDQFLPKPTATKFRKQNLTKFHVLITTYEVILKDIDVFKNIQWKALLVDEAHRLKNPKARLFAELLSVPRDHCVLLTGTPLANATEELWALLHFCNRKIFPSKDEFLEKFGQLTDASQVAELHSVLRPYLLRRVKEDVEKSLPPKEETIFEVSLTPTQKKYYKAIFERNTVFLFKGTKPSNAPSLMNVMMELRKCCNHPYLVRGAEERILAEAAEHIGDSTQIDYRKLFGEQLVKSSGKMVLINKLLPKLYANGHKVLIFSQMVRVLDLLEEMMKLMKYKYERLDGSTSSTSRAAAVDRFKRPSCQRFVMLLSTRAGGLGLNLTAADIVIIFDSDWNPQNDLQAMARAHRIGQTRSVRVYRLLTAKTYEMHMFHSASMKLGLERAVLSQQREQGEGGGEKNSKSKSKQEREAQAKEIDQLLKKGAYDVFRDDDDEEAKKFMETDIDQLMESSAKKVTYGQTQNTLSSGLGSFSKASFVADTADGEKDVDLDDPDFWSKAVGLEKPEETPEEVKLMVDDGVKRVRKQVEQFDPYAHEREVEERRQHAINQKILADKEERDRIKEEKRKKKEKKQAEKDKKRKEKEEARATKLLDKKRKRDDMDKKKNPILDGSDSRPVKKKRLSPDGSPMPKSKKKRKPLMSKELEEKLATDPKLRKLKRAADRKRSQRRAENSFPPIERLRQAWDVPQRNRVVAAFLRFGFGRFIKIRTDSGLHSLPIQDLEVFLRSYTFQLGLQLAVSFMELIDEQGTVFKEDSMPVFLTECLGFSSNSTEFEWLSDCLRKGMLHYLRVEEHYRLLKMPLVLAEPTFMASLQRGPALRSLRRISLMSRLERVIKGCLDSVVDELGYDQLGQRGCASDTVSLMDIDLLVRHVTAEELKISIGLLLGNVKHASPAVWWDRSCDIALLIGTFVHGFGNYEGMKNDSSLPFKNRLERHAKADPLATEANSNFLQVAKTALAVCDDAFEASKMKAQREIQKAVAAAAAAREKIEEDAAALRTGGSAAEEVTSRMEEPRVDDLSYDGKDDHFITLPRLKTTIASSLKAGDTSKGLGTGTDEKESEEAPTEEGRGRRRALPSRLPFPDARVLNCRLGVLLSEIEKGTINRSIPNNSLSGNASIQIWPRSNAVSTSLRMRNSGLEWALSTPAGSVTDHVAEWSGIGLNGSQCEVKHRLMDDRHDYSIGSASPELAGIANGIDSHRYLRSLGVPMALGRFGLSALVHAEENCLNLLLENERNRFYGHDAGSSDNVEPVEKEKTLLGSKEGGSVDGLSTQEKTEESSNAPTTGANQTSSSADESVLQGVSHCWDHIPVVFRESDSLRAAVCVVLLYSGYADKTNPSTSISADIKNVLMEQDAMEASSSSECHLLDTSRFRFKLSELCDGVELPSLEVIDQYVQKCLLPHCLKLSLYGNGSTIWDARGSKGEFETASGTSRYQEPSEMLQSPLPDPCLPLAEQSIEAVGTAVAILRRVRLMKCCQAIARGEISSSDFVQLLRSKKIRQSMHGLPVWWCPWIHDVALVCHASSMGLFAILQDKATSGSVGSVFSEDSIVRHIRSAFQGATEEWIMEKSREFPTMHVLERRMSFVCSLATEKNQGDNRYENIPMFDHGGWPRN